jgi:N-acetyl-1-D-myo-inositol-2-amino-2-deoxy-alpha-D-glucopyranoside deacetylase
VGFGSVKSMKTTLWALLTEHPRYLQSDRGSAEPLVRSKGDIQGALYAVILLRKAVEAPARVDLLVVAPHPDDESVTTGALLARYAAMGLRTAVVTCTRGEEGEIVASGVPGADSDVASLRPHLGAVRAAELRAACGVLGVAHVRSLGYRDSGMVGTASTYRADAFCNADLEEATGRLVSILRELRPTVVVTESAWGTYGHPDHVMARTVALRAFAAAGSERAFPTLGLAWRPARLYAVHPTADRWGVNERWDEIVSRMRAESQDAPFLTRWSDNRGNDEPVTTLIDVARYVGVQHAAIACHRTQFPTTSWWLTMPTAARRVALGTSRLARLYPLPVVGEPERDLFPSSRPHTKSA